MIDLRFILKIKCNYKYFRPTPAPANIAKIPNSTKPREKIRDTSIYEYRVACINKSSRSFGITGDCTDSSANRGGVIKFGRALAEIVGTGGIFQHLFQHCNL